MAQPFVLVGTPCYGGQVTHHYTVSLLALYDYATRSGIGLGFALHSGDALITRARSQIVADFLTQKHATHLLFIDADIGFSPDQFARLLTCDKDMAAAQYPVKDIRWHKLLQRAEQGLPVNEAGLMYTAELAPQDRLKIEDGFATATYAATGFLLIKRAVIERMIAAYPETKFQYLHSRMTAALPNDNLYALFECMIDPETSVYMSEDYAFCRRWTKLGGEIWVDLSSKLTHVGPYAFKGDTTCLFSELRMTEKS